MNIRIDSEIRTLCPGAALGLLHYTADAAPSSPALLAYFEQTLTALADRYALADIAQNPNIAATRAAYRTLGKNPHEYRNAAEAMLRRIVKGQGLYHINSIIEVNNLVSVTSGWSIGTYDLAQLHGDITLRRAPEGAHYGGIGKGSVNIGHLPVLYDAEGPFGNPTSDSRRAMVQPGRRELLSVIYGFDGGSTLSPYLEQFRKLLQTYCGVAEVQIWTV